MARDKDSYVDVTRNEFDVDIVDEVSQLQRDRIGEEEEKKEKKK